MMDKLWSRYAVQVIVIGSIIGTVIDLLLMWLILTRVVR